MIRVLVMIAAAGFVLCVGSLSAAVAIGGPDALARGSWGLADDGHWNWWRDSGHDGRQWSRQDGRDRWDQYDGGDGNTGSRTVAWTGAQRLDIDLIADVRYIQDAASPGTVEISGPQHVIDDVEVGGDTISFRRGFHRHGRKINIVVRAPNVRAFDLSGVSSLKIEGYKQPNLSLDVSGNAEVIVIGETDEVSLDVSGSGDANLSELKTKGARVDISGAADATIAPTDWAKLDVTGMGDIRLLTSPPRLESDISGAGKIRQGDTSYDRASPSPSPSASPTPSPTPSPPATKGSKT